MIRNRISGKLEETWRFVRKAFEIIKNDEIGAVVMPDSTIVYMHESKFKAIEDKIKKLEAEIDHFKWLMGID